MDVELINKVFGPKIKCKSDFKVIFRAGMSEEDFRATPKNVFFLSIVYPNASFKKVPGQVWSLTPHSYH